MVEIEAKIRPWGNSAGIIIPKEKLEEMGAKLNDIVKVNIEMDHSRIFDELFGFAKRRGIRFSKSTDRLLKEADEALSPKDW